MQSGFNSGSIIDYLCKDNEKVLSVHSAGFRLHLLRPRTIRPGCIHVARTAGPCGREIRARDTELQHSHAAGQHRLLELLLPRNRKIQPRRPARGPERFRQLRAPQPRVHQRLPLQGHHRKPLRRLRSRVQGLRQGARAAAGRDRHLFLPRSHLLPRPAFRGRRGGLRPLYKEGAERPGRLPQPRSVVALPGRHDQGPLGLQPGHKAGPIRTGRLHTPGAHILGAEALRRGRRRPQPRNRARHHEHLRLFQPRPPAL